MSCVLRVAGSKAAVRSFTARTSLPVYRVFFTGEPLLPGKPKLARTTGFNVSVSSAPGSDVPAQVRDAIRFCKKHAAELRRMRAAFKRGSAELDFSVWATEPSSTFTHSYRLPPSLMELAARYGFTVRLSIYPTEAAG